MPTLDVFATDAFNTRSLIAAVQKVPYQPGRVGRLALFQEAGMTTTIAMVELRDGQLELITSSQRGAPGSPLANVARTAVPIAATHLVKVANVMADEVQNVRAFGSETDVELVQGVVNDKLFKLRPFHEVTLEWHRIGALKGQVLDADGATVLLDLFTVFNLVQQTQDFEFTDDQLDVADACTEVARMVEAKLGSRPYTGLRGLAGKAWLAALRIHPRVAQAYQFQAAQLQALGGDIRNGFTFGGITFEEYRGSVSGQQFIADDQCYVAPEGAGIFLTRFAPADYMETVNTPGLPIYAKQEIGEFNKFVKLETQSNPLNVCTQPDAVIKCTQS